MSGEWKIGVGAGSIILGVYFLLNFNDIGSVVLGAAAVAFGFSLIASNK